MRIRSISLVAAVSAVLASSSSASAETPRELLALASFEDADRSAALAHVNAANGLAAQVLTRSPSDYDASLVQAMAVGYRAKLLGSRSEAMEARRRFEALVLRKPGDAEAQLALAAWHMGALHRLGRIVGGAVLGARRSSAMAAMDRAVRLAPGRPFIAGLAGLLRLQSDPLDGRGTQLIEIAAQGRAATPLDASLRRASRAMLPVIRAGDVERIRRAASAQLPLGKLSL